MIDIGLIHTYTYILKYIRIHKSNYAYVLKNYQPVYIKNMYTLHEHREEKNQQYYIRNALT